MIRPFPFTLIAPIFLIFPVAFTTPAPVFAATDGANGAPSSDSTVPADPHKTTVRQPTSRTETDSQFSREDKAQIWGLSEKEWDRYETLMQGMHGYRSNTLDPLTLLGIEARTDEERRRYAEQLARLEHDRVQRLLDFQRAYDDAFARLYPNEQAIADDSSPTATPDMIAQAVLNNSRRPRVFTALARCAACDRTVRRLVNRVASGALPALDIYVVGANNDDSIRDWARSLSIPADRVRRGQITLNHAPDGMGRNDLPRVLGAAISAGE
ncbi:TIGR03759 family integrating conjugative element protein [Alloalcanivorax xenomutans]|uniref:Integrating conjugative element protein, PFL_4693 family n=1 Tax=Alcanivorax xiamenensis TaxID=1177156 RepID=A0ABQ6Y576_9GAMM|nr:TIGR03759 family integrating conjugative element protein [Alcanivorax xiamenensis]KAF0804379.1 hypothetical protein A6D6_03116 [Alcanivorax xiamenensis]